MYPVALLCEVMLVNRSGYYTWRKRGKSKRQVENEKLVSKVQEIHLSTKGAYGTRRMSAELEAGGHRCGRYRARTLMNLANVEVKRKHKFKVTTDSKHRLPVFPNLLNREFDVTDPDRAWVSDITYVWTHEGWLYLAVILDLFNRQVVGWSMSNRMSRKLVIDTLQMAVWRRHPVSGLIFHSDRGSQYCSDDFKKLLKKHGMFGSMSRKGDCWDNAVAESFFGSLKTERVFLSNYKTREDARQDIIDYIEMFYNSRHRHSYLGYLSPMEYEKRWFLRKVA